MKHVKTVIIASLALAAIGALAGTASATVITSPDTAPYTGKIVATSTNSVLENSTIGTIKCTHSEIEGTIENHGNASTAEGKVSKLTFTGCTGGEPTSPVATRGSIIVHAVPPSAGETQNNGTTTSTGASVTIHKTLVGTCTFVTNATDIGLLTSSTNRGNGTAVLDIGSSPIPQKSENIFCPSSATWTGNYTVTTPDTLNID